MFTYMIIVLIYSVKYLRMNKMFILCMSYNIIVFILENIMIKILTAQIYLGFIRLLY